MSKLNTLEDWGREVYTHSQSPGMLANINVQVAGQYAYITSEYVKLKLLYVAFYDEWKYDKDEKKRSDKMIDNMWMLTKEGAEQYKLKRELRAYEQMMSAIKSATIVANQEAKNQY